MKKQIRSQKHSGYTILFTPTFDRAVRKLDTRLLEAVSDAIEHLKDTRHHPRLKIHRLHGRLKAFHAASVDYRHRIVFRFVDTDSILLVDFGDHSVYDV